MAKGKTGGSLGGRIVVGEKRRKRRAKARKREEARWQAQNGPVIVRMGESEIYVDADKVKSDLARARALLLGELEDSAGDVRPT